jgi:hypothetical protein
MKDKAKRFELTKGANDEGRGAFELALLTASSLLAFQLALFPPSDSLSFTFYSVSQRFLLRYCRI